VSTSNQEGDHGICDVRRLFFAPDGCFPPGIHDCTLDELRPLVFTNPYRQAMWYRLVSFLIWPVLVPRFSYAYIGGGFLSTKPEPKDVDVILQTKEAYGPESFATVERFFMVGLETIREIYSVDLHFWMEGAPGSLADYRAFFQYERPQKEGGDLFGPSRGVARISLTDLSVREQLRRQLSPVGSLRAA
jgi:hypothetical protein